MSGSLPSHLSALTEAEAYPHPVTPIRLIETHLAWIFLTGCFAYKIKRPVRYPFVDQRALETRSQLCADEIRLNQRFAPQLYLDVCRVVLENGKARIAAQGEAIEYAVRMREFDTADELDQLLQDGRVAPRELECFGATLARIHRELPVALETQRWGWPSTVRNTMSENLKECAAVASVFTDKEGLGAIRDAMMAKLNSLSALMTLRLAGRFVRECHGDLHSRNIVRLDGKLCAYDCMEFEPAFRWIDVAEDVAFLIADLEARGYPLHAHGFLQSFLSESGDYTACKLLGLYKAHHALVRAKVIALTAVDADPATVSVVQGRIRPYTKVANAALDRKRPRLILMSGLSGSGKSTLARELVPVLEAIHLQADLERKRLAGFGETSPSRSGIGTGIYSVDASDRAYARLAACAQEVIAGGYDAIVDATFMRREHRRRFRELTDRMGIELKLIHCHAPPEVLRRRVVQRELTQHDASEATVDVLQWQIDHAEPLTADEGFDVMEVDTTRSGLKESILSVVGRG